jgi:hypothetical protein
MRRSRPEPVGTKGVPPNQSPRRLRRGKTKLAAGEQGRGDIIELVAFMTEKGTLSIRIGNHTYSKEADAGLQTVVAPLEAGVPRFSLKRGNNEIIAFDGNTMIYGNNGLPSGYNDLTYWSGSASAPATCFTSGL